MLNTRVHYIVILTTRTEASSIANEFKCDKPCVHKNTIYFIFYRFDEDIHHVELDYPRDMSIWRGIGYHIDAAFQYKDGKI